MRSLQLQDRQSPSRVNPVLLSMTTYTGTSRKQDNLQHRLSGVQPICSLEPHPGSVVLDLE
ncbi:unnamed protein product [Staurois parvus]|uniref:Uncharacterized protein n=1 Tax=Staurois parvus TaxID=386267 RepID=A0ABN9AWT4_9NEOB|nr:unnamed protein product [Staurois parvus]